MFINTNQESNINTVLEDMKEILNATDNYAAFDEQLDQTDFRSILYITPAEQKQLAFDMIESMVLYVMEEARKLNITNRQVLILTTKDKDNYWTNKFGEFQDHLQIFHDFNILCMTLLSYTGDKNQYTVIIDQDISDLVCFEGINAFQSFLSLPFVIDGKFEFLTWCSDDGLAILVSMFWDMFTCKLAFKDSLDMPLVAEIFGENDGLLIEPSDFKMCSANTISSLGLKKPLDEQFFESLKPLGEYFVS